MYQFRLHTVEAKTLRMLGKSNQPLGVRDIAKWNGVHETTESKRLHSMANKGLIIYECVSMNKTKIRISKYGRRILNALESRPRR